jgi:hypothetical protein
MLIGLSGFGGCSSAEGPPFRPEVVEPARAVIYIYRPPRSMAGSEVEVSIDQVFVGRLGAGQYLAQPVEPGLRMVRVVGSSDAVREISLVAGDSAFLEVHSSYWNERPEIDVVDGPEARDRIAQTGKAGSAR